MLKVSCACCKILTISKISVFSIANCAAFISNIKTSTVLSDVSNLFEMITIFMKFVTAKIWRRIFAYKYGVTINPTMSELKVLRKLVKPINCTKMKYSVVLLFGLAVAGSFVTIDAIYPTAVVTSGTQIGLGTLFFNYIRDCVSNVVKFVLELLMQFIPGNLRVPIRAILSRLRAVRYPNVGSLILISLRMLGVNGAAILNFIPVAITNTRLNMRRLWRYFSPLIRRGSYASYYAVSEVLRRYFTEKLTYDLASLLNRLPEL